MAYINNERFLKQVEKDMSWSKETIEQDVAGLTILRNKYSKLFGH